MSNGLVKIELVGALRYGYKGEKFERNLHYMVRADRAATLLALTNDAGFYMFREVTGRPQARVAPAKPKERKVPVVDTTQTDAEKYDEAVAEAMRDSAADDVQVVVQPSAKGSRDDISEEEALAALEEEDKVEEKGETV